MGKKIILLSVAAAAIFSFQNCGKAGFESQTQMNLASNSASSSDAKVIGAPFPYEVGANVISYMSCPTSMQSTNLDAYYTFKAVGAESYAFNAISGSITANNGAPLSPMAPGGIRLKPDYLAYMDKNFKGLSTQVTSDLLRAALQTHPDYKYARPQLSFRKTSDLRNSILNYPTTSGAGQAAALWILDILSTPLITKTIADNRGTMVSTFPKLTTEPVAFSSAIGYSSLAEQEMATYRQQLSSEYYLTFALVRNDGLSGAASPTGSSSGSSMDLAAYPAGADGIQGKGYSMRFDAPPIPPAMVGGGYATSTSNTDKTGKPLSTIPTSVGIQEYDLESVSPTTGTWSCLSYGIVRYQDRDLCPVELYQSIKRDQLDLIRKILRVEDWQVNTTLGCIVPTASNSAFSCYTTQDANPVAETQSKDPLTGAGTDGPWATLLKTNNGGYGYPYSDPAGMTNTGIEYRYWTKNCGGAYKGGSYYRECVNFATFCYKRQ